jgi:hypothetical protein
MVVDDAVDAEGGAIAVVISGQLLEKYDVLPVEDKQAIRELLAEMASRDFVEDALLPGSHYSARELNGRLLVVYQRQPSISANLPTRYTVRAIALKGSTLWRMSGRS